MSAMAAEGTHTTLRLQQLMGRRVVGADGRHIGRVVECLADAEGDELRVRGLLVGPGAWITRFGSAGKQAGRFVPWEHIVTLTPHITLRPLAD
jgi:sporulation protein YlmC with PRC-barrel domain